MCYSEKYPESDLTREIRIISCTDHDTQIAMQAPILSQSSCPPSYFPFVLLLVFLHAFAVRSVLRSTCMHISHINQRCYLKVYCYESGHMIPSSNLFFSNYIYSAVHRKLCVHIDRWTFMLTKWHIRNILNTCESK